MKLELKVHEPRKKVYKEKLIATCMSSFLIGTIVDHPNMSQIGSVYYISIRQQIFIVEYIIHFGALMKK